MLIYSQINGLQSLRIMCLDLCLICSLCWSAQATSTDMTYFYLLYTFSLQSSALAKPRWFPWDTTRSLWTRSRMGSWRESCLTTPVSTLNRAAKSTILGLSRKPEMRCVVGVGSVGVVGGCTLYMKLVYWQIESSFLILWWWCMAVHSWWSDLSDNDNYWYSKRIILDFLECSSVQTVSFEFLLYKCSFSSWCNSSPDLRSAIRVGLLDYTIACCIHHSMHVHWLCNVFWLLRCVVRFNGLWGFLLWTHLAPSLGFTIL